MSKKGEVLEILKRDGIINMIDLCVEVKKNVFIVSSLISYLKSEGYDIEYIYDKEDYFVWLSE